MTLSINIKPGQSVNGGLVLGVMTAAGNPWLVPDALANELVNRGVATANWANQTQVAATLVVNADGSVAGVGGVSAPIANIHNIKNKFFASLQNGANYRTGKSLNAAPAWTAGVNLSIGYVCQNAGNLYGAVRVANVSSNGVTTLAGSAPTGTGAAPIIGADLIPWLYLGPVNPELADQNDAPAYSWATVPAACSLAIQSSTTYPLIDAFGMSAVAIRGSDYAFASGGGGGFNGVGPVTSGWISSFAVDLMTDAPVIALSKQQHGASYPVQAMVNGYPVFPKMSQSAPYFPYTGNNNLSLVLDWTAKPNKVRRVRVHGLQIYTGVWIPPQYSVWKPSNPNSYRLYFEGDSFTQGGASGDGYCNALVNRVAAMLGCDDAYNGGIGGGGFLQTSNDGTTILSRVGRVIAAAPDILCIHPTGWDETTVNAAFTPAARRTAYKAYFDAVFAALPNIIIIASGDRSPVTGVDTDMAAVIAAYNHPHLKYLDANMGSTTLANAVGRAWYSGNGSVYTAGTVQGNSQWQLGSYTAGPANVDEHTNVRGLEALQWEIYSGIVGVMNTLV